MTLAWKTLVGGEGGRCVWKKDTGAVQNGLIKSMNMENAGDFVYSV